MVSQRGFGETNTIAESCSCACAHTTLSHNNLLGEANATTMHTRVSVTCKYVWMCVRACVRTRACVDVQVCVRVHVFGKANVTAE